MAPGSWTRRRALATVGSLSLGGLLAACGDGSDSGSGGPSGATAQRTVTTEEGGEATVEPRSTPSRATNERFDDAGGGCRLSTELTGGPYYFDVDAIRRDITEDRDGMPLRVGVRVREAGSCEPLENAVVDVWHCDAVGTYSGFEAASRGVPGSGPTDDETYLRGAQVTDADGIVEFKTIYPGFYPGRTVHIHAKVHLDRSTLLTTQFFFDDRVSDRVFSAAPYAAADQRRIRNDGDGIYDRSLELTLSDEGDGMLGLITLDVQRT